MGLEGCAPSGGSRQKSISLLFRASTGCPLSLARGPHLAIESVQPVTIFTSLALPLPLLSCYLP